MYQKETELLKIDPVNERKFAEFFGDSAPAHGICACGHPSKLHKGHCQLSDSCSCYRLNEVGVASDPRPFFQVTHGPIESHALGRGMKVATELGIEINFELHCKNWCKNFESIGACRLTKNGNSILPKMAEVESHVILCNLCVNDIVFGGLSRLG